MDTNYIVDNKEYRGNENITITAKPAKIFIPTEILICLLLVIIITAINEGNSVTKAKIYEK